MGLSLDLSLAFVPKTISEFLSEVSRTRSRSEKLVLLDDFIKRLEDEMKKIDAFKRELPLCMLLVNDAIMKLKEETLRCMELQDRPVIEEFIPLKQNSGDNGQFSLGKDTCDKKNWMNSAQLWSTETKSRCEEDDRSVPEKPIEPQYEKIRGATFVPFNGNSSVAKAVMMEDKEVISEVPSLSLLTPASQVLMNHSNSKSCSRGSSCSALPAGLTEIQGQPQSQHIQQSSRKQRRCWSPELHRRFVDALQRLGGPQVATPKQIRELMQVEGLTNDEVKSHLQKYRLHVRKVPVSQAGQANGLWMAEDQCEDKSKEALSQSVSPQGPLLLGGSGKALSSSGRNSMEVEEDEKSDCRSWKGGLHYHAPAEADVLS